ncbi:E3 ubiquitin ligase [Malassezia brasiliensis]|uniref:E3 ubiquitin ligase n=1 Tax=Malassezia brasiliensis TaxID=1821822 RepID=A0AAF0DUJ1_9BASI|nr:E3 ubiquitin ligase [Malassezia brasiliensis]
MRSSTKRRRADATVSEDEDAARELKEAHDALESLWALKGVLDAVRSSDAPSRARTINKDVWEGLFDPATFYHIIRDQEDGVLRCGACASEILEGECTNPEWYVRILTGSGILYEDWEDDGEEWHRSEAVNIESDEEAQSTDDEAGSLEDFVVDDDEEEDAGSQASYRSSDSGIVSVSPPHEPGRDHDVAATRTADSNTRPARVRAPSSDEDEEGEGSSSGGASMSSDIAALEDPDESESDSM